MIFTLLEHAVPALASISVMSRDIFSRLYAAGLDHRPIVTFNKMA